MCRPYRSRSLGSSRLRSNARATFPESKQCVGSLHLIGERVLGGLRVRDEHVGADRQLVEQRLAAIQPLHAQTGRQGQAFEPETRPARVLADLPRVVPRSQEPRMLAGPDQRPLHEKRREHHAAGHAIVSRPEIVDRRCVARVVVARRDLVKECARLGIAGQEFVGCVQMVGKGVRHRAHDRQLVGQSRQPGKVLADVNSRHLGRNRVKIAADALGCVGLHVERVEMTQAAREKHQDHRPGTRRGGPPSIAANCARCRGPRRQPVWQSQSQ